MKFITATLGALVLAAASFVGTAQAQQGYYSAPGFSQGGPIYLGYTGNLGYSPNYYYGQPQYVVRRTMKPIWALGAPVTLGNPAGNAEVSFYSAMSVSTEHSIPLAGTFEFGPSLGLGARIAWNDPYSNLRVSSSMTATKWEIEDVWDGINDAPYLAGRSSQTMADYTQISTDIGLGIVEGNSWLSAIVGINTDSDYSYALPYAGLEFGSQAEIAPGVALDFSLKGLREFSEPSIRGFHTSGRWIATGTVGLRIKF